MSQIHTLEEAIAAIEVLQLQQVQTSNQLTQLEQLNEEQLERAQALLGESMKAQDYAKHAFRVDHYGYIWRWDTERQEYVKTTSRICTPVIADEAVTTEKLAPESITSEKIPAGAVTTEKIGDGQVKSANIGTGAVTTEKIGDGEVKSVNIGTGAVTSDKIPDGHVTNDKIGAGEVKSRNIADGAVTGDRMENESVIPGKIADDAVQTRNIKDGNVTNEKLADEGVSWEKLDANLKNIVETGGGQHGIPLSTEFGNSDQLGITQRILTESRDSLQSQIDAIVSGGATVSLSASPATVFVGVESTVSLTATTNTSATLIKIKKGSTEIAEGSGTSLGVTDTITPDADGNIAYNAEFIISGLQRQTTKNIQAVYPIRTAASPAYTDGTALTTPKASPAGTYQIPVTQADSYIYFNVPATMQIHGATMGGFTFPIQNLSNPDTVQIEGVSYSSYKSSNTYPAGQTLTIVLN